MMHPPVTRASSLTKQLGRGPSRLLRDGGQSSETAVPDLLSSRTAANGDFDDFFLDASSEAGSFYSALSSPVNTMEGRADDLEESHSHSQREKILEKELDDLNRRCMAAESVAAALDSQKHDLEKSVEHFKEEVERLREERGRVELGHGLEADERSAGCNQEAIVARLVATAIAKATFQEEAELKWKEEVELLRSRIQRSSRMEAVADRRRQLDRDSQDSTQWRLVQFGFAATCLGLGALTAVLLVKSSRQT